MVDLPNETIDLRVHIIGDMNDFGIALISTLRQDHLHELCDNINVRVFQIALLQGPIPVVPPGVSVMGLPEESVCCNRLPPIEFKPPGLAKVAKLNCAKLCCSCLSRERCRHNTILRDHNVVALEGIVIAGRTVSPSEVTVCPDCSSGSFRLAYKR